MSRECVARPETNEAWLELVPLGDLGMLVDTLLGRIERGDRCAVSRGTAVDTLSAAHAWTPKLAASNRQLTLTRKIAAQRSRAAELTK